MKETNTKKQNSIDEDEEEEQTKLDIALEWFEALRFDVWVLIFFTLFLMGSIETLYMNETNKDSFNYKENICKAFNCNYQHLTPENYEEYNFTGIDFAYFKIQNIFVQDIIFNFYESGKKNPYPFLLAFWVFLILTIYNRLAKPIYRFMKPKDEEWRGNKKKNE